MADNVQVTAGTGTTIAADEVVDGTLGTVKVQYIKLMDATINGTNKLTISSGGAALVDGSATTQPISGSVNQGTANATPWTAKITDGTNAVAIKAASTPPAATDPAFVVAISPNSVNANGQATMANSAPVVLASNQSAIPVNPTPQTSGGLLVSSQIVNGAPSVNSTNIKGSAGQIYHIESFNNSSVPYFLKFANITSVPTPSVSSVFYRALIPGTSGGAGFVSEIGNGIAFSTGISIWVTGGIADNDTTSLASNVVIVNVGYK